MQGSLSIERMCELGRVSRAGFYRSLKEQMPVEEEMEVRSAVQQIFLEHRRRYGSRRIARTLRRQGMVINRKRVVRIMQENHLLAIQPKSFVVTTDSDDELEVYLNIASRMKLTGINQLWVADITYIRLKTEFVYLAVILDASGDYVRMLRKHQLIPSMSRPANPYDNASCESFIKTLKREEIYANSYQDLEHLRADIEEFIERYYNRCRLHSALGYQSPEEFEQAADLPATGATMSFFRHTEIYRSDGRRWKRRKPAAVGFPAHRLDESPAGYSLAGCSPAEPASASPADGDIKEEEPV
jgi:putative transposase